MTTETRELHRLEVISEAVALIDRGLGDMLKRELVSTDEVADLLLDVRTLLSPAKATEAADDEGAEEKPAAPKPDGDESGEAKPEALPSSN